MNTPERKDGAPWRNFYGRRFGKTLRKGQVVHLDTTLKDLQVPNVGWDENPERLPVNLVTLFGRQAPLWLEIGFGGGEHLLHQAIANPLINLIGCEPFINGVAMLVPRIAETKVRNVRIHPGDARNLFDLLPAGSVEKAFLLYPDPWPKSRHHKRRFVNAEFIDPLAKVIKSGGEFRVATDIPDYVRHTLEHFADRGDFRLETNLETDLHTPWPDWPGTRYEAKALQAGRKPHYLTFIRL